MRKPKIVVLGRMCEEPVAGVVWQVLHYLIGLQRLGFEVYYVEWRGNWLPHPIDSAIDAGWPRVMVGAVLRQYGFAGRWICSAEFMGQGCTFGDLPVMPIYWYTFHALVKSNVHGFFVNPTDNKDLTKVSIK